MFLETNCVEKAYYYESQRILLRSNMFLHNICSPQPRLLYRGNILCIETAEPAR